MLFASAAGAAWLTLTGDPDVYLSGTEAFKILAISEVIFSGLILFAFVFFGIPAYLLGRSMNFAGLIPAAGFGFLLGMAGSLGFGVDATLSNVIWGATTFGVAGVVAAYVFLSRVGPYEHDEFLHSAPPH
jgi:phage shock protein PspC (stress-responsive transcriptional regulator)